MWNSRRAAPVGLATSLVVIVALGACGGRGGDPTGPEARRGEPDDTGEVVDPGDGAAQGDTEDFCEVARRGESLRAGQDGTYDPGEYWEKEMEFYIAEAHAHLSEMLEVVPDSRAAAWIDVQRSAFDPESPDYAFGWVSDASTANPLEQFFDPKLLTSTYVVEQYLHEKCGIEPTSEIEQTEEGLSGNIAFPDLSISGSHQDLTTTTEVQAAVEEALPALELRFLVSRALEDGQTFVSVAFEPGTGDALEVCEAAVEYLDRVRGDDAAEVRVPGEPLETLARRVPGGDCTTSE